MKVRQLSPTGDYVFMGQPNEFLEDSSQLVAQMIITSLNLWQGQWFMDTQAGVPWLPDIIGKDTLQIANEVIKAEIQAVSGVQNIVAFSSSLNTQTRKLIVIATVNTIYGQASITTSLG